MNNVSQSQDNQPTQDNENKALPFDVNKGWVAIPNAIYTVYTKHPQINATAILVYGRLLHHHNHNFGYAYPTFPQLANDLGLTPDAIKVNIRKLVAVGLITKGRGGQHNNNRYFFHTPVETVSELIAKFPEEADKIREYERKAAAILEKAEADKERLRDVRKRAN